MSACEHWEPGTHLNSQGFYMATQTSQTQAVCCAPHSQRVHVEGWLKVFVCLDEDGALETYS